MLHYGPDSQDGGPSGPVAEKLERGGGGVPAPRDRALFIMGIGVSAKEDKKYSRTPAYQVASTTVILIQL